MYGSENTVGKSTSIATVKTSVHDSPKVRISLPCVLDVSFLSVFPMDSTYYYRSNG